MRPRRARRAALLALLAVTPLGCGDSAVQQFRGSLAPLQQNARTERAQIAATLRAASLGDESTARMLDREIAALARMFSAMARIKAPGDTAQRAFAGYNRANMQLVAALYGVAQVVRHGSVRQLAAAGAAATDVAGADQRASDALDAALSR